MNVIGVGFGLIRDDLPLRDSKMYSLFNTTITAERLRYIPRANVSDLAAHNGSVPHADLRRWGAEGKKPRDQSPR